MKKKTVLSLLGVLLSISAGAYALVSVFSGNLVNEPALAYSKNYDVDLEAGRGISAMSAQAIYSSATVAAQTFLNGQISTGSITINTLSALTTAYATDILTVNTLTGIDGIIIGVQGHRFKEGVDWRKGTTTTTAATSLAAAIAAALPSLVTVTHPTNTVVLKAIDVGSYYNTIEVKSSTPSAVSAATDLFTGGQDNAVLTINGVELRANDTWYPLATPSLTSINLAASINANPFLSTLVTATANTPAPGVTRLVSISAGEAVNYDLNSSTPAALSLGGDMMGGGLDSAFASGTDIALPAHGFSVALPVLYTGAPAIGGLTTGTTYFIGVVDEDTIALATTSLKAQAADYIELTAPSAQAATDTYTLTPLPITGTSAFLWKASNDYATWTDLGSSTSVALSTSMAASSIMWDLGTLNYHYVRLGVTGPTTGGLELKVVVNSKH